MRQKIHRLIGTATACGRRIESASMPGTSDFPIGVALYWSGVHRIAGTLNLEIATCAKCKEMPE